MPRLRFCCFFLNFFFFLPVFVVFFFFFFFFFFPPGWFPRSRRGPPCPALGRHGEMPLPGGRVVLVLGFVLLTALVAAVRGLPVSRQRGGPRERSSKLAEVSGERG